MKKITLLSLFLLVLFSSKAQFPGGGGGGRMNGGSMGGMMGQDKPQRVVDDTPRGNFKLIGTLIDSATNKPVEYGSVALHWNKKVIDGAMADANGNFTLKSLAKGTYTIELSFVGYKTKSQKIVVPANKGELNLGSLLMTTDTKVLKELVVQGQAALVEDKVDRTVYNAEKDISNAGGTAEDVLKKVPMLSVDLDGNVSIRGSTNIKVLINNKPSSIVAGSLADAIKQIPADQIKSVEVITSPSAKYDSEGTGGIINIVMKKNNLQGITGSFNIGAGNRGTNLSGNVNLKTKKLGIALNFGGNAGYNIKANGITNSNRYFTNRGINDTLKINQNSSSDVHRMFGNAQLSVDYDFDTKNSVTLSSRLNSGGFGTTTNFGTLSKLTRHVASMGDSTISNYYRHMVQDNQRNNYDFELDYSHKFSRKDEELSFMAQYSRQNTPSNYTIAQSIIESGNPYYTENNKNTGSNGETTFQLDYTLPLAKTTFEAGAKTILRHLTSDFTRNTDSLNVNHAHTTSNLYVFDQNVYATYMTYAIALPSKWNVKGGIRYEYTTQSDNSSTGGLRPNYGFLAPSLNISKDLPKNQKLKFNYAYRIQRPSLMSLNPYVNYSDATTISYGNTHLDHETTHAFELGYSKFFKANSVFFTLFYRNTANNITSYNFIDSQRRQVTTNINDNNNNQFYGVNLFVNLQVTPSLRIGGGGDFTHSQLLAPSFVNLPILTGTNFVYRDTTGIQRGNSGWGYRINGNIQYKIMNGLNAQLFGFYGSPNVNLQGTNGGFYFYNIGIKKDFKNKKGNFGVSFDNPFTPYTRMITNLGDATFSNYSERRIYNQGVRFTFSYNFGKMTFDDNSLFKRKKSVNNDDTKSDTGSGDQTGGAPQGGGRPR